VNNYIEQLIMMNDENGDTASGTGPSAWYIFVFLFLFNRFLVWFTGNKILLLYSWIKFNKNLPNFLTIQKLDSQFSVRGFATALKPETFNGTFYKRWRARMILWLTTMNCYHAAQEKSEQFTPEEESSFETTANLFRGALISVLDAKYIDSYISHATAKELWDALNAKFGVSDAGSELYLMEKIYEYKMVEDRSMVGQAHEVQLLAKELNIFFVCCLTSLWLAVLSPSYHFLEGFCYFCETRETTIQRGDLIGTINVEERARAKDTLGKGVESSRANAVQKKNSNFNASHKKKKEKKEKPT
jgi:hypothetical protein